MSSNREEKIIAELEPAAIAQGFELVAVEATGSGKNTVLRVFLDKPELSIDDLAAANDWVGALIDDLDPFKSSYLLEVSSPGIDRPLRTREHFERFSGEEALIITAPLEYNTGADYSVSGNRARWSGILRGVQDDNILLECDDTIYKLPFEQVKRAHIKGKVDFSRANES